MLCSVPNCGGKAVAKGLCDKHRKRLKRNGSEYIHINKPWGAARTVRADGYLGYAQGVLVANDILTLEECKQINMKWRDS